MLLLLQIRFSYFWGGPSYPDWPLMQPLMVPEMPSRPRGRNTAPACGPHPSPSSSPSSFGRVTMRLASARQKLMRRPTSGSNLLQPPGRNQRRCCGWPTMVGALTFARARVSPRLLHVKFLRRNSAVDALRFTEPRCALSTYQRSTT